MKRTDEMLTVTELAAQLGVTPRTIRFYEAKGLVSPQRVGTTRVYTARERARLLLVLRGKRLGFSLADIRRYLELYDADPTQLQQIHLLSEGLVRRIAELEQQREDLDAALEELRDMQRLCQEELKRRGVTKKRAKKSGRASRKPS